MNQLPQEFQQSFYPEAAPSRSRRWPWVVAIVVAVGAVVGVTLALTQQRGDTTPGTVFGVAAPPVDKGTELRRVFTECHSGDLDDDDHTLVIDSLGEEPGSGSVDLAGLACLLDGLDTPQSVVAKMNNTRALDGMVSASWGEFDASWTYHPDNGLDVIITQS